VAVGDEGLEYGGLPAGLVFVEVEDPAMGCAEVNTGVE
jgi:hypothetical protein